MDFQPGAEVIDPEGGRLGDLVRVIYDPETGEVPSIVVERTGFRGGEAVVPIGTVDRADEAIVQLAVWQDEFDQMEYFAIDRNIAPPPIPGDFEEYEQDPMDVPDVPPVGAATGIESIAFTPVIEEVVNAPVGDRVLDAGTSIWATDGEIGRLKLVRIDDATHRIFSILVETGTLFLTDIDVPIEMVEDIQPETVILNVGSDALRGLEEQ